MKNSAFKKVILVATAMLFCSLSAFSAEMSTVFNPSDLVGSLSYQDIGSGVAIAMAGIAIPAYNLENLKAATQSEFADLQAKFGKLYVIDVSIDESENYQFIVRRPTRQHLELLESNKNDLTKANDIIIKNLVIAGDVKALDDGIVFSQFNREIAKTINQGNAFLAKA